MNLMEFSEALTTWVPLQRRQGRHMWVLAELTCLHCGEVTEEVTELVGEIDPHGGTILRRRCARCGGPVFLADFERRVPVVLADEPEGHPAARRGRPPKGRVL